MAGINLKKAENQGFFEFDLNAFLLFIKLVVCGKPAARLLSPCRGIWAIRSKTLPVRQNAPALLGFQLSHPDVAQYFTQWENQHVRPGCN